jgi:hypothetical protein
MNPIQQMTPHEKNIAWMKMLKPLTHNIWFLVVITQTLWLVLNQPNKKTMVCKFPLEKKVHVQLNPRSYRNKQLTKMPFSESNHLHNK